MFNLFKKTKYTYEQLLVINVMKEIQQLINQNPFEFLPVIIEIVTPENKTKVYTYIFNKNYLYLVDGGKINIDIKDLNLSKYCYKFKGNPKNFLELDKYEFLFSNIEEFKARFQQAVDTKKKIYKI